MRAIRRVQRARPPSTAPSCLHATFILNFVFANTHDHRYFEQKRKDIAARERNITLNASTEGPAHATLTQTTGAPRFMGGGFKLAHTTRELETEQA